MNYDTAIQILNNNDIFPKKQIFVDGVDGRHITGLRVYCSSLLKDKKTDYIKGLVGHFARVDYLPNDEEILIEI